MAETIRCQAPVSNLAAAVAGVIRQRGLAVLRSFDFAFAPEAHPGSACPYHGTAHCNCGVSVMLIYSASVDPVVLMLLGFNEQIQAHLIRDAGSTRDPQLAQAVLATLLETACALGGIPPLAGWNGVATAT